jgi:hypothetical protein
MFRFLRRKRPPSLVPNRSEIDRDGVFDYLALAALCDSRNSFNRLHIELENVCAPAEIAALAVLDGQGKLPPEGHAWLQKLRKLSPGMFDAPRSFLRHPIGRNFFLYEPPQSDPSDRGLLIAITGNARRLLLPVSMFLQAVDPARWDVLVVVKEKGASYLDGLDGVAPDFPGVVRHIETTFTPSAYRRTVTFGVSNGGFPSAWAALLMGAERGICVCGVLPNPVPPSAARPTSAPVDLVFVYGRDSERDRGPAMDLNGYYGGTLLAVPDISVHNVLEVLLARRELSPFLDRLLA